MDFRWRVPSDLVPMLEGPPSAYEENPCLASKYDGGLSVVGAMFRNGKKKVGETVEQRKPRIFLRRVRIEPEKYGHVRW